jgi:hypothetical protein
LTSEGELRSLPDGLPDHTFAITLGARDEEHLLEIERKLERAGIPYRPIREPDAPYLNAMTAIGIFPFEDREMARRSILGKLRLANSLTSPVPQEEAL